MGVSKRAFTPTVIELGEEACACFMNVLKYMGDYQTGYRRRATNELTDAIFDPALKHVSTWNIII